MKKGSKLYSVLNSKCPHCHEGDFFSSSTYNLKKMGDIYDSCSVCGNTFVPETGFYFGAMYVSYALGTALLVSIVVGLKVLSVELEILNKIFLVSGSWLLLTPKIHTLSKIIWANIFMDYKTNKN